VTQHAGDATLGGTGGFSAAFSIYKSLQPDADSIDGTWTDQSGGTSLFAALDEIVPDDNDYIQSTFQPTFNSPDVCKIRLSDPTSTPGQPFNVEYRYQRVGYQPLTLTVRLLQGNTIIASWFHELQSDLLVAERTLTAAQFASISDFNDLFLQFTADTSYIGPGDIYGTPDATSWWGLRGYSNAKAIVGTTKSIRLRRDADNAEQDFLILPDGSLDVASITAFASGFSPPANLLVVKFYDQVSTADFAQATSANQPDFQLNVLGSFPAIAPVNAHAPTMTASINTTNQPCTLNAYYKYTSAAADDFLWYSGVNNQFRFGLNAVVMGSAGPGITSVVTPTNVFTSGSMIFDGLSNSFYVAEGTPLSFGINNAQLGTGGLQGTASLFPNIVGNNWAGFLFEIGQWPIGLSVVGRGQAGLLYRNQARYWGDRTVTDWIAAGGNAGDAFRQRLINNLIIGLKTDGLFINKFYRLWLFAYKTKPASDLVVDFTRLVQIISASGNVSAPAFPFVRDQGAHNVDADLLTDFFYSNTQLSNSFPYQIHSCHMSAYLMTSIDQTVGTLGAFLGLTANNLFTDMVSMLAVDVGSGPAGGLQDTGIFGPSKAAPTIVGHWMINRTAQNKLGFFYNGEAFGTPPNSTAQSTFSSASDIALFSINYAGGGNQYANSNTVAFISVGAGLTDIECRWFYERLRTFLYTLWPYKGPADIIPDPFGFWGLRAISWVNIGLKSVRIRRSSDNAEQDFVTVQGGGLDLDAISTFQGASTDLFVVKMYDQSGNDYHVGQTATAQQPKFIFNALGSMPGVRFNSADVTELFYSSVAAGKYPQPTTGSFVAKATVTATGAVFGAQAPQNYQIGYGGNTAYLYDGGPGSAGAAAVINVAHAVIIADRADGIYVDGDNSGSSAPGGLGTDAIGGVFAIGGYAPNGLSSLTGDIHEVALWNGDRVADFAALNANQHAFWRF
jgi:hypothetical protein